MNNEGFVILSILVPSIPERWLKLNRLKRSLESQLELIKEHYMLGSVEVIYDDSLSFLHGGLSIGKKRQSLVEKATGKYLCFLDDDESISPNYIESLLRLCNYDLDICTFRAIVKMKDSWGLVDMRLSYKLNDQFTPEHTIRRPPWHMCPVRTEFAKLYEFKNINNAEDFVWMAKVLEHCTTESHTDKILFQYNHSNNSEADKITNAGFK